jgi:segregation and condensation protein A
VEYQVKIDAFEGPLDLLLFLIKDKKMSIDNINVSLITEQYIKFIHDMEELNLEVASEYLVMAAHLIFIKSKMMLPKAIVDDENLNYEENPEEKLKMRLKIYKLFKDIVPQLQLLEEERANFLTKIPTELTSDVKFDVKEMLSSDTDLYDLLGAYNRVLRRYALHKPMMTKIEQQQVTIEDRIREISVLIKEKRRITFDELFTSVNSKEFIVVTFMAILELSKEKVIKIQQEDLYEEIYIDYVEVKGEINE